MLSSTGSSPPAVTYLFEMFSTLSKLSFYGTLYRERALNVTGIMDVRLRAGGALPRG
jgi:hypothetical protein